MRREVRGPGTEAVLRNIRLRAHPPGNRSPVGQAGIKERNEHELDTETRGCAVGSSHPCDQYRSGLRGGSGGVRTTVTLWLNGQQTEAQIGQLDDDTWKITEGGEDAKEYSVTAGGAYTMKDGDAGYQLDGQSVVDALSEGAASSYQNYM